MNCFKTVLFLTIVVLLSLPVSAEIYSYNGEQGDIHYTYDVSQVPEDQRDQLLEYAESEQQQLTAEAEETDSQHSMDGFVGKTPDSPAAAPPKDLNAAKQRLETTKQELDAEYQALLEERQELDSRKVSASGEDMKELNLQILELNDKIEIYEKKRRAFNSDVETYNASVAENNTVSKTEGKKNR